MQHKKWSFVSSFVGAVFGSLLTIVLLSRGILPIPLPTPASPAPVLEERSAPSEVTTPAPPVIISNVADTSELYKEVIRKSMPSVVGITTTSVKQDFFFQNISFSEVGTGVIVDADGYILTNSHVIDDGRADEISVILSDGEKVPAQVLWHEKELDLAVIKINKHGLPAAVLGDSDYVEVGDIAIAIGNPLGLQFERSVTQGIISGLNRRIQLQDGFTIEDLIQTDASINQGNSGGPLLNAKGQVIGINSAKVKSGEGLGFAIPINIAKPIVDEFIETGDFQRVYLGIRRMLWIDLEYYKQFMNIEIATDDQYGVYVDSVIPDSPADRADIRPGDIITRLDGQKLDTKSKLLRILYQQRPGKVTDIIWLRDGKVMSSGIQF